MTHCAIKQNGVVRSGEDVRNSFAASMFSPDQRREAVVCPKPRRLGLLDGTVNDPSRPLRWHLSYEADLSDSKSRSELLDIILAKGHGYDVIETNYNNNNSAQLGSSSPPFFCGSPPSRVSNPLIQDARFLEGSSLSSSPTPPPPAGVSGSSLSPTSASARKGGCVRASFGKNPAVRIEGFDYLDRDRSRNCRIPALA
ncbi:hypothetical protein V2J09_003542 [Rumex salicifolius]